MRRPKPPAVAWGGDGVLRDVQSEDVFFSVDDGLAETRLVFLEGCGLPEAWAGRDRFAVGELGFGVGLNALALWDLWARARPPGAILHLVSIEAALLDKADAARALAAFPELGRRAARLIEAWPVRAYAPQRFWAPEDGFALTVLQGEAQDVLASMSGQFDAWFLDGFAPARNPAMWRPEIFVRLAALSRPGARAATYSVAAAVRAGLAAAGFSVARRPGHGRKRERLEAHLATDVTPPTPQPAARRALIMGSGLAGAHLVSAFARRGVGATVLEAGDRPAAGASGNPAGLLSPRLDRAGVLASTYLAAYLEALRAYGALGADVFDPCGVILAGRDARQRAAIADLLADPPLPEAFLCADPRGARAGGGVVRPAAAVELMLGGADVRLGAPAARLERREGVWRALDAKGALLGEAPVAVLACGPAIAAVGRLGVLPMRAVSGQIEWGPAASAPATALTGDGYVAPFAGGIVFGATFQRGADPLGAATACADGRAENLARLAALDPACAAGLDLLKLQSRAGLRAVLPDHAPIAGALEPGLYALGGFGARGITLAPLLAEATAAMAFQEPALLSLAAEKALSPLRFVRTKHG